MTDKLPDGWTDTTVGDVATYVSRGKSPKYTEHSTLPVINQKCIRWAGLQAEHLKFVAPDQFEDWSPERFIQVGDILWNSTGTGTIGRASLVTEADIDPPKVVDSHVTIVRVRSSVVDPRYLHCWIRGREVQDAIGELATGTTNQIELNRSIAMGMRVPLPPLHEQRRIVETVETLLARIEAARGDLEAVPVFLRQFRQRVLSDACSGRLTEEWRGATEVQHSARDEVLATVRARTGTGGKPRRVGPPNVRTDLDLFDLPDTWQWVNLGFLMSPGEAFCYGVVQPGADMPDGVPLVRAGDLHNLAESLGSVRRVPREVDAQHPRSRLLGGEILVTVVGANVGTVAMAPIAAAGFNIARAVAKVPVREFLPEYVLRWLQTPTALRWMVGDAREVARPTLNLEQLETLPVPLPPREEQAEIARQIDALFSRADAADRHCQGASERVSGLTSAVLAKAFDGELVDQESAIAALEGRDFESGEELLRRFSATAEPERAVPLKRRARVRPSDKETIKEAIRNIPERSLTFDDLRQKVPGDYEALKEALFELLEGPKPVFRQVFDTKMKTMRFVRAGR